MLLLKTRTVLEIVRRNREIQVENPIALLTFNEMIDVGQKQR